MESSSPVNLSIPISEQSAKSTKGKASLKALQTMQKVKLTATGLIDLILAGKEKFAPFHDAFLSPKNWKALEDVLTKIFDSEKTAKLKCNWMLPCTIKLVCEVIHGEMEVTKCYLQINIKDITPEFIKKWDINNIMGRIVEGVTPM
jgi:hypothetical protein